MRDMYNNIPGFQADEILPEDDPFYDPAPWFQFVGRSYIYIKNLLFKVPMEYSTPIFSEKGEIKGQLHVEVSPFQTTTELVQPTWLKLTRRDPRKRENTPDDKEEEIEEEEGLQAPPSDTSLESEVALTPGENLVFFITVREATGLSSTDMTDVFSQIRFLNEENSTFPSNPPCRGDLLPLLCLDKENEKNERIFFFEHRFW